MQAYRIEKIVPQDGVLILDKLPFKSNDVIEIIILRKEKPVEKERYPLRGKLIEYNAPFEPVAQESRWDNRRQ